MRCYNLRGKLSSFFRNVSVLRLAQSYTLPPPSCRTLQQFYSQRYSHSSIHNQSTQQVAAYFGWIKTRNAFGAYDFCKLQVHCITRSKTPPMEASNCEHYQFLRRNQFLSHQNPSPILRRALPITETNPGKVKFRLTSYIQASTAFPSKKKLAELSTSASTCEQFYSDNY